MRRSTVIFWILTGVMVFILSVVFYQLAVKPENYDEFDPAAESVGVL